MDDKLLGMPQQPFADVGGPIRSGFLFLLHLAWESRLRLPVLLIVGLMVLDVRMQLEIDFDAELVNERRQHDNNIPEERDDDDYREIGDSDEEYEVDDEDDDVETGDEEYEVDDDDVETGDEDYSSISDSYEVGPNDGIVLQNLKSSY